MHLVQLPIESDDPKVRLGMERYQSDFPRPVRESIQGYAIHKRQVLHFPDVQHGPGVPEGLRKSVEYYGNYSTLDAPMFWEGRGIGALSIARIPPKPFSDKEIELLQTFADQAAIAIQNARLFRETQEALERQTATAEILQAISGLKEDLAPVISTIIDCCQRLIPDLDVIQVERITDGMVNLIDLRTGPAVLPQLKAVLADQIRGHFPFPVAARSASHLDRAPIDARCGMVITLRKALVRSGAACDRWLRLRLRTSPRCVRANRSVP